MSAICDTHKKNVDVELWYNSVHRRFNQLEIRPVGEKMLEWGTCPREAGPPGPRLSPGRKGKKRCYSHKSGGQYVVVLFGPPTPSHTQSFQIYWEVYFSKELCRSSSLCCRYDSTCICIVWLYNTYSHNKQNCLNSNCLTKLNSLKLICFWQLNCTLVEINYLK